MTIFASRYGYPDKVSLMLALSYAIIIILRLVPNSEVIDLTVIILGDVDNG